MSYRDKIFCNCPDGKHTGFDCVEPNSVIEALKDAGEEMNYSNWANDRFDRAEDVIKAYCKKQKIPMRFKYADDIADEQPRYNHNKVYKWAKKYGIKIPFGLCIILICAIFALTVGCARITYKDDEFTYSRFGRQSIEGLKVTKGVDTVTVEINKQNGNSGGLLKAMKAIGGIAKKAVMPIP